MGLRQQQTRASWEDFRDYLRRKKADRNLKVFNKQMKEMIFQTVQSQLTSQDPCSTKPSNSSADSKRSCTPESTVSGTPAPDSGSPSNTEKKATPATSTDPTRDPNDWEEPASQKGPTLGPMGTMNLESQLRYLTIQFSLELCQVAPVRNALLRALELLQEGSAQREALNGMIEERLRQPGFPSIEADQKDIIYYVNDRIVSKAVFDLHWQQKGVVPVDIDLTLPRNPFEGQDKESYSDDQDKESYACGCAENHQLAEDLDPQNIDPDIVADGHWDKENE